MYRLVAVLLAGSFVLASQIGCDITFLPLPAGVGAYVDSYGCVDCDYDCFDRYYDPVYVYDPGYFVDEVYVDEPVYVDEFYGADVYAEEGYYDGYYEDGGADDGAYNEAEYEYDYGFDGLDPYS